MKELDPEARKWIERAEGLGEPDPADVARVREALLRKVGAAAAVGAATGAATTKVLGSGSAWLGAWTTKITIVVVLATAAGGAAWVARSPAAMPVVVAQSPRTPRVSLPAPPTARSAAPETPPTVVEAVAPTTVPSSPRVPDVTHLKRAQEALVAGDARAAIAAATRIDPRGPFAEQREGLLLVARCQLGEAGSVDVEAFEVRWPRSPLGVRARSACTSR